VTLKSSQGAQKVSARNPKLSAQAEELIVKYERKIADHNLFIQREGVDPPEIASWTWG
jgi:phosphoketolase